MNTIKIEKLSQEQIQKMKISEWPVWEKEKSEFDWSYDSKEECLFLKGKVVVKASGQEFKIEKGDFVTFPKGLSCTWKVIEPVKKHYRFSAF